MRKLLFLLSFVSVSLFSQDYEDDTLHYLKRYQKTNHIIDIQTGLSVGIPILFIEFPIYEYDLGYYYGINYLHKTSRDFYYGISFFKGLTRPYFYYEGKFERYNVDKYDLDYYAVGVSIADELIAKKNRFFLKGSILYYEDQLDASISFSLNVDYSYNIYKRFYLGISSEVLLSSFFGLLNLHVGPVVKYRF